MNLPPHAIASDHPNSPSKNWSITELAWIAIRDQAFREHERQAVREAVAAAVPEGWKLVPIDPTPEMCRAFFLAEPSGNLDPEQEARIFYQAMLEASPEVKP